LTAELLLQWGIYIDGTDINGQTALFQAIISSKSLIACTFIKRNANTELKDKFGKKIVDYALTKARKDSDFVKLVTMLRITNLNLENSGMNQQEFGINEAIKTLSIDKINENTDISSKTNSFAKLESKILPNNLKTEEPVNVEETITEQKVIEEKIIEESPKTEISQIEQIIQPEAQENLKEPIVLKNDTVNQRIEEVKNIENENIEEMVKNEPLIISQYPNPEIQFKRPVKPAELSFFGKLHQKFIPAKFALEEKWSDS
jgi:hypothetical protein